MRKMLTAALLLVSGGFAHAADAVVYEEPAPVAEVAPGFTWTGAYVGLQGGYAWTNGEFSDGVDTVDEDFDGGLFGAHAGFNWQSGSFVGGVEVDVEHVWNEQDYLIFGEEVEVGSDWQGSARLRAGYAMDRTLIYATGGVAIANAFLRVPALDFDESETFVGWTAGAGVEHAFTDNWTARLEYRYADFGSEEIDDAIDVDLTQHTVRLGVSYKF